MAQLSELFHRYKCLFFRNQQALGGDDQVRRVAELQVHWGIAPRSEQQRRSVSEGGVFVHPFLPQKKGAKDIWPVRYEPPAADAEAPFDLRKGSRQRSAGSWQRRTQPYTSSANVWHSDNGHTHAHNDKRLRRWSVAGAGSGPGFLPGCLGGLRYSL